MIEVKIILHNANSREIKTIGRLLITNISKRGIDSPLGDYYVRLLKRTTTDSNKIDRKGYVKDYPRKDYHVGRLVLRALKAVFTEEE